MTVLHKSFSRIESETPKCHVDPRNTWLSIKGSAVYKIFKANLQCESLLLKPQLDE